MKQKESMRVTVGIQGMQAVSNLPISAWLPAAARRVSNQF